MSYTKQDTFTKEWLREQYEVLKKPIRQIAREIGWCPTTLRSRIKSWGIKVRDKNQHKVKDLTGKTFWYLTAIKIVDGQTTGARRWLCQCRCGRKHVVLGVLLSSGISKSCGCWRQEVRRNPDNFKVGNLYGGLWKKIIKDAETRNLSFEISQEFAWELYLKQNERCALTGIPLSLPTCWKDRYRGLVTASLDRIDSTKGYTEDNVQWVHKNVNLMKMDFPQEEFLYFCKRIADYDQTDEKFTEDVINGPGEGI